MSRRALLRAAAVAGAGTLLALAGAPPAGAAGSHLSVTRASDGGAVAPGGTVTADDVLRVRGRLPAGTSSTSLVVTSPTDGAHRVAEGSAGPLSGGATLAFDLATGCLSWDPKRAPCTGRRPAPNGTWTVALQGGLSESRTLVLRIPPAAPTGVMAARAGRVVTISWQRGPEPDLRSYDVLDEYGGVVASGLAVDDVCHPDGSCAMSFREASTTYGTEGFVVRAERATCPSCTALLASPGSSVTVDFGPAPTPSPSPTAAADRPSPRAAAGGPGRAAPPSAVLGRTLTRYLPVPAAARPPDLPRSAVAPLPEGTFRPQLAYGDQTVREAVRRPALAQAGDVTAASHPLWRSLAAALLLVLAAGHLWAWLHRSRPQ